MGAQVIQMPRFGTMLRHAARTVVVVSVAPMAVFYAGLACGGLRVAVLSALAWYYGGVLVRIVRRQPVLGAAALAAALLTVRAVITLATSSAFIYFLQPVAGTVATATAFATTALAGRPLLDRLAHDFCPLPEELSHRLRERRFFTRLSVLWSGVYLVNAVGTVCLLLSASIGGFVVVKSIMGPVLTALAALASYLFFRRVVRHAGLDVRWGGRPVPVS